MAAKQGQTNEKPNLSRFNTLKLYQSERWQKLSSELGVAGAWSNQETLASRIILVASSLKAVTNLLH